MNVREELAQLTEAERLVYAAAFANATISKPDDSLYAMATAWVAVLRLRDDETSRLLCLRQSIDWNAVRDMWRVFKSDGGRSHV